MPFFVAAGTKLFLPHERFGILQLVGFCCAFGGVVAAFSDSMQQKAGQGLSGDLMMVGGALLWASVTIVVKAGPLNRITPAKALIYQLAISGAILPMVSWGAGESGVSKMSALGVACLLYQTVWVAFITYLMWFWLVLKYPASKLASFIFLTPFFGVIFSSLFLDEPVTASLSLALVLVGVGIYLVNRPPTSAKVLR